MKIAIIDIDGGICKCLIESALDDGHRVRILSTDPNREFPHDKKLHIYIKDKLDVCAIRNVSLGCEAVVLCRSEHRGPDPQLSLLHESTDMTQFVGVLVYKEVTTEEHLPCESRYKIAKWISIYPGFSFFGLRSQLFNQILKLFSRFHTAALTLPFII